MSTVPSAEARLAELGIQLPKAPRPVANYVTFSRHGSLLFLSGHGPAPKPGAELTGKLGDVRSIEEGYVAARQTGLSMLATIREALGSLDAVTRVVKILGLVNAAPGFLEHPKVINGCSDLFVEVFGEEIGRGARSAVGASSLPGDISTEIEGIFAVREA